MIKSIPVVPGKDYSGTIPEGAVRLLLLLGEQGMGEVEVGDSGPMPLYYGKNEYVVPSGVKAYKLRSEESLEVVEDFVSLPSTVDDYVKAAIEKAQKDMQTKLDDHEARIASLESKEPGPSPQQQSMGQSKRAR